MKTFSAPVCLAVSVTLAGCGSGGDDIEEFVAQLDLDAATAEAAQDAAEDVAGLSELPTFSLSVDLYAAWEEAPYTDATDLPTTGTGVYSGTARILQAVAASDLETFRAYGTSVIVADYASGTIEGAASEFYQVTNREIFDQNEQVFTTDLEAERIDGGFVMELSGTPGTNLFTGTVTGSVETVEGDTFEIGDADNAISLFSGTEAELVDVYAVETKNGAERHLWAIGRK